MIGLWKVPLLLVVLTSSLLTDIVGAQEHAQPLHSPETVRGFVGGESHDSYVVRARKEQRMTVEISWRHDRDDDTGDNHAEFFVSELPNFDGDGAVKFGSASQHGKRWTGKVPRTGDYYIYVTAHPSAHYTLRVRVE
jgi:hypothetical protein